MFCLADSALLPDAFRPVGYTIKTKLAAHLANVPAWPDGSQEDGEQGEWVAGAGPCD